jgi:hypothetical protein
MPKDKSTQKGYDRWYPCHRCEKGSHPSVTTLLDVIASRPLMGWLAKNGVAKLNVLKEIVETDAPDIFKTKWAPLAEERWHLTEETAFWKSGKEVGKEAADIGTLTHAWIEAHIHGKEVTLESLPEPAQAAVNGFLAWEKQNRVEYLQTEQTFYHCALDYAGTADCVAKVNGELSMLDWKTARGIYANYVIQDWLYALADESQHGDRLYGQVIVGRFGKDGTWEAPIFKRHDPIGMELAREVVIGCRSIFKMNQIWDRLFLYTPKPKGTLYASPAPIAH